MKQAPPGPAQEAALAPSVAPALFDAALPEAVASALASALPVRGFPGGIGDLGGTAGGPAYDRAAGMQHDRPVDGAGREAIAGVQDPGSSVWQRSWQAWDTAEIAWQRPAEWARDSIETHTEPIPLVVPGLMPQGSTAPEKSASTTGAPKTGAPTTGTGETAAAETGAPKTGAAALRWVGQRRLAGLRWVGQRRLAGLRWVAHQRLGGRRAVVAVVASIAVLASAIAAAGVFLHGMAAPHRLALVTPFVPARFTGSTFGTPGGTSQSELPPSLTTIGAAGRTVVAAGSVAGAGALAAAGLSGMPARLPFIMVSADGGSTWRRAMVRAIPDELAGSVPVMAAGGDGRWLALGHHYAWTSADGVTWQETTGITPTASGDHVQSLVRTGSGFLAAGVNVTRHGRSVRYRPVIWRSANGRSWHRRSGAKTGLPAGGGGVLAFRWAAAHPGKILLGGQVSPARGQHEARRPGQHITSAHSRPAAGGRAPAAGAWRSTDGGLTWARVSVPVSHGASRRLAGITESGVGFVALRPSRAGGGQDVLSYLSRDGLNWRFGGTITAARSSALRVTSMAGGQDGVVTVAAVGKHPAAFVSPRGYVWQRAARLHAPAGARLTGLAAVPGGQLIAALAVPGGQPSLLLAGRTTRAVGQKVLAAAGKNVVVNGVARKGREEAAAGSTDGVPAIWWRRGNGPWRPASMPTPVPSTAGTLTGIAHGRSGWLAVGRSVRPGPAQPVVMASPDGRVWHVQPGTGQFVTASPATPATAASHKSPATAASQASHTSQASAVSVTAVAAWRAGFVAAGAADGHLALWKGQAGTPWQLTTLAPPAGAAHATLTSVAVRGGRLAVFGTASTQAGPKPFQEWSPDGGHSWRVSWLPVPGGFASVTAATTAGGGFIVAGVTGSAKPGQPGPSGRVLVWWSPDGQSWHVAAIPGRQAAAAPRGQGPGSQGAGVTPGAGDITALIEAHGTLTGFGNGLTSSAAQRPVGWHARLRGDGSP